jgi:hypothetical protein
MKQLTIVAEHQSNTLSHMSYLLGRSHVAVQNLTMSVTGSKAVIHLTVKDMAKAQAVLNANGFRCFEPESLVVRLKNLPEELGVLMHLLSLNKIGHESPSLLSREDAYALYALKVEQPAKANRVLAPYLGAETEMLLSN